ncbi:MAG: tetratricopeptide repeat protein [Ardenticatenaceae bacterium]|nr:tetratricopeptide repeat protein [Ardenticatenaceae bacterium]
MHKETTIKRARELRQADELEESQAILLELLDEYADDPLVLFEVGGAYDVLGEANEAIDYYEQAIENGLEGSDLQECMVCLGLNHRAIGEFEESVEILQDALARFPEDNSIRVFLALAHYSDDAPDEAVRLLLDVLLKTTKDKSILTYADTLDYYKDNLDEVWDE